MSKIDVIKVISDEDSDEHDALEEFMSEYFSGSPFKQIIYVMDLLDNIYEPLKPGESFTITYTRNYDGNYRIIRCVDLSDAD
jgi:hypothetical protein